jgi:hypothetical protein
LRTPESLELLLLKHAQKLGLKLDRQFANFIEEKRTSVGGLKTPYSMCQSSSEGASFMSKEFALDQRCRNGRAVNCYKPLLAAGACIMNGSCDDFLPCTRFTLDKHGTIHGRHGLQLFNRGEKIGTRSNEAQRSPGFASPPSRDPFTNIGRTILEFRSASLAESKEFHGFSIDQNSVCESMAKPPDS